MTSQHGKSGWKRLHCFRLAIVPLDFSEISSYKTEYAHTDLPYVSSKHVKCEILKNKKPETDFTDVFNQNFARAVTVDKRLC